METSKKTTSIEDSDSSIWTWSIIILVVGSVLTIAIIIAIIYGQHFPNTSLSQRNKKKIK